MDKGEIVSIVFSKEKYISYTFAAKILSTIILSILLLSCKTQHLGVVKLNGKFGCINRKGKLIIKNEWDWILQGYGRNDFLIEKDSLYGFIDRKGHCFIKPQFADADLFREGLAPVSDGKKHGFINKKGRIVISLIYDDVFMGFHNGLSDVERNDSCGYIDKKGKVVIPLIYEQAYPFMSAYAQVLPFNGDRLLVNKKGVTFHYDEVDKSKRLWAPRESYPGSFETLTGQGRKNGRGEVVVPPVYKVTGNLIDGMYIVQDKSGKWGAYNKNGKLVIEPMFDEMFHYYEGLANFKLNNKWGYINKKGEIVIKPQFDYAGSFEGNRAYVEVENRVGFIDKSGKFAVKPIFEVYRLGGFR
ncbi:MAG: WG repeat-containing protein [Janthinobacterium lividum]